MKKKQIIALNKGLIICGLILIISSVILEFMGGKDLAYLAFNRSVGIHLIIVSVFTLLIGLHILIHQKDKPIYQKFAFRNKPTKVLMIVLLLTAVSGIPSTILFIAGHTHHIIGGIHGKFGLIFIILSLLHIKKRFRWFRTHTLIPIIDTRKCISCQKCVKTCPASVFCKENQVIVKQPCFCIQCNQCVVVCPRKAISRSSIF